jgi:hypothetical protein
MSVTEVKASANTCLQKRLIDQIKSSAYRNGMIVTVTNQSYGKIAGFE